MVVILFFNTINEYQTEGASKYFLLNILIVIFEVLLIVMFFLRKKIFFKYLFKILTIPLVFFMLGVIGFFIFGLVKYN